MSAAKTADRKFDMRKALFAPTAALLLVVSLTTSYAQDRAEISGQWSCDRFCLIWDSGASIVVDGEYAVCANERGNVCKGRLLTNRSVRCFGIVGQLADDNESIQCSMETYGVVTIGNRFEASSRISGAICGDERNSA